MAKIAVNSSALDNQISQLELLTRHLGQLSEQVEQVNRALTWEVSISARIRAELGTHAGNVRQLSQRTQLLKQVLGDINERYQRTERELIRSDSGGTTERTERTGEQRGSVGEKKKSEGWFQQIVSWFRHLIGLDEGHHGRYEVDSILFDEDGSYGGDQGAPESITDFSERRDLYDIVRRYYPNMSDEEIARYLTKLNSEGCSYVAVVNTILAAYEGREAEFERTFGFPLYAENGDLNYNRLIVDYYTATDNHNKGFFGDKYNPGEDESGIRGHGANLDDQRYRLDLYLDQHGVRAKTKRVNITPENFEHYARKGSVVIFYYNGNIYPADGGTRHPIGAHAMTVTGVTEDGRYIVSSWGGRYYLDPKEVVNRNGGNTGYSFLYIEY